MENRIAIVHRSEIVRRGFASLLNAIWKKEIFQMADLKSFSDSDCCSSYRLLAFIEAYQLADFQLSLSNLAVVAVFDGENQDIPVKQAGKFVHLSSDFGIFQEIISDFRKNTPQEQRNENELTQREKEILRMVAMGYSNKEIADTLFISIHTVITHRKNITGKLGIKSISGLTVYAIINRLIDPDLIDPEKLI